MAVLSRFSSAWFNDTIHPCMPRQPSAARAVRVYVRMYGYFILNAETETWSIAHRHLTRTAR